MDDMPSPEAVQAKMDAERKWHEAQAILADAERDFATFHELTNGLDKFTYGWKQALRGE